MENLGNSRSLSCIALLLLSTCGTSVVDAANCVDSCVRRRQMQAVSIQAIRATCIDVCAGVSLAGDKWLLTNAEGKVIGVLKPDHRGFEVNDAGGRLTARIRLEADLVRVRNADGAEVWSIKRKEDGAEIVNAAGERLFRIKVEEGRWKLEDSSGNELAKCRLKDDGYEVHRTGSRAFARVMSQDGRLVFETIRGWPPGPLGFPGSLEGVNDARAGTWFTFENFSLPQQASLFVYFLKVQQSE